MKFETSSILAVAGLIIYGAVVAVLLFHPIPVENREVVAGAVGFIGGTLVGSAFAFYFGSSKGSQAKDDTIASMAAPPALVAGVAGLEPAPPPAGDPRP